MVSTRFANRVRGRMLVVGKIVAKTNLSPNAITVIGLGINVVVAAIIASGNLLLGGILLIFAGLFDVVDGAVARVTNQTTKFGAFFDSTLDRYADAIVLGGLLYYFTYEDRDTTAIMLTFVTLVGSLMISYTRSRAETLGIRGDVGFAQRAERVIILSLALIVGYPIWGLWILAVLTQLTVLQRVIHVWRALGSSDSQS
jgi:CDP-diacylglycerol--glycerol-3-phosphate 3-phosphatidyltransferase